MKPVDLFLIAAGVCWVAAGLMYDPRIGLVVLGAVLVGCWVTLGEVNDDDDSSGPLAR